MRALARLLVRVFFRRVEVQHAERLPGTGPVVLVANHINGLVDGLLLIAMLRRFPRFLGKSTLFRIPPLWPFLKLGGVIPVYRLMDGASGSQNASAFAKSHELLARGGMVALFPEGISHDESSLQPLKTGAARIALEAGVESGVPDVVMVAVGLNYDAKARFRSRALIRLGHPVAVGDWAQDFQRDSHQAVRRFTEAVADQLNAVNPPHASWTQSERLSRMAEVAVRVPQDSLPREVALGDQTDVADRLALAPEGEETMVTLTAAFTAYERDLDLLGLNDGQVAADYAKGRLRRNLIWSIVKVVGAVPFAAVGFVIHIVPFQFMKWVATRPSNEGIKATVKLLGCFVLFALTYTALGVVVARAFGPWLGLLVAVAAPVCGYATVRLAERIKRIGGLLEGYRTVTARRAVLSTVVAHRADVVRAARAVLESI
jgi:glycerol-3-phosphate O-acyltransferase/dihydroxyacetone phosphate acyltransferase